MPSPTTDFRAAGLQLLHRGDLVVGQQRAAHVGDPYLDGEPVRGGLVVAGQQQRGGAGQLPSGGDLDLKAESRRLDPATGHQHQRRSER